MKKRVCRILCPLSGCLFFALALWLGFSVGSALNSPSASIIGGEDTPTLMFLLRQAPMSFLFWGAAVCLVSCIVSGVVLLISNRKS
jgi:hypothetical protein